MWKYFVRAVLLVFIINLFFGAASSIRLCYTSSYTDSETGLRVSSFAVVAQSSDVYVGDKLTITFYLENVSREAKYFGSEGVFLISQYEGFRANYIGNAHENETLSAGSKMEFSYEFAPAAAGKLKIWPAVSLKESLREAGSIFEFQQLECNIDVLEQAQTPVPTPTPIPRYSDADGDGVIDSLDLCPNTASGLAVDENGCHCKESDNGLDYITKGSVIEAISEEENVYRGATDIQGLIIGIYHTDECLDEYNLKEYYCDRDDNVAYKEHFCPYGCEDGACICPDIDGLDENTQSKFYAGTEPGPLMATPKYYEESCKGKTKVLEYYCDSEGNLQSEEVECASGTYCKDGACIEDKIKPIIDEVTVKPEKPTRTTPCNDGDNVIVTVKAHDNESGIKKTRIFFPNTNTVAKECYAETCTANVGDINTEKGLILVDAFDKSGNVRTYTYELETKAPNVAPPKIISVTHSPIHPEKNEKITFRVEAEATNGCEITDATLLVNHPGINGPMEMGSCDSVPCEIELGPFNTGTVAYSFRVTNAAGVWTASGYKNFVVGWPANMECVPIYRSTFDYDSAVDIVFIRDKDYNAGFKEFVDDVENIIYNHYFDVEPLKSNKEKLSFYIMKVSGFAQNCGTPPKDYYDHCTFSNAVGVLHKKGFTDCAHTSLHKFSAEGDCPAGELCLEGVTKAVLHEEGHAIWGLADEYKDERYNCTSYFEPDPHGNIWDSLADAQNEALANGWNLADIKHFCPPVTNPNCGTHKTKAKCEADGCKWYKDQAKCLDPNHCCGTGDGWYKICKNIDIMERGFKTDEFGIACQKRINWILDNLPELKTVGGAGTIGEADPEKQAEEQSIKTLILNLHIKEGKIWELGKKLVYNIPPKKIYPEKDYKVEFINERGDVIGTEFFDSPYLISIEYNGDDEEANVKLDDFDFTWVMPFYSGAKRIVVKSDENGKEVLSVDLRGAIEKFCEEHSKDSECYRGEEKGKKESEEKPAASPIPKEKEEISKTPQKQESGAVGFNIVGIIINAILRMFGFAR